MALPRRVREDVSWSEPVPIDNRTSEYSADGTRRLQGRQILFTERRGMPSIFSTASAHIEILTHFQPESDRLDFMHVAFRLTYGLFLSPVTKLENALDIGTGTGIWAIDLGEFCMFTCISCLLRHVQ